MLASSSQIDDAAPVPGFVRTYVTDSDSFSSTSEVANITDVEIVEKRKGRKRKIEPMDVPGNARRSPFSMSSWMRFGHGFVETP